jgi:hypothetical protein
MNEIVDKWNRSRRQAQGLALTFLAFAPVMTHGVGSSRNRECARRTPQSANAQKAPEKRAVAIEDAIEMTRIGNSDGASLHGQFAFFSPDRRKFVVVLRKGHVQSNSNEYFLLLWRTQDVFGSAEHEVVLTLSSSSNRPAIQSVHWLDDNETVLFLGEHPSETQQVYRFNCRTRELTKITDSRTNVISFAVGSDGTLVYTAEPLTSGDSSWQRFGRPISTELITDVLLGYPDEQWSDYVRVIKQPHVAEGSETQVLADKFLMPFPSSKDRPVVSPNGRYVLLLANSDTIPTSWLSYSESGMQKWTRWDLAPGQYSMLRRWILFDAETRTQHPLLNAPVALGGESEAAWSPDCRSVVITNSYLPLDDSVGEELEARRRNPFVVEINVALGEVTKIASTNLKLIAWDRKSNELIGEEAGANPSDKLGVHFQKQNGRWERVRTERRAEDVPVIAAEEGVNLPPRLVATRADGSRRVLLDLNPEFAQLKFGNVERIHWKARDGHEVEGGLYYPADYVPGRRYPLVIQTHGFQPDRFEIDGPYTSAFAAQPLAGKGIMVLQAEKPDRAAVLEHIATGREAQWRLSAYEGAIDTLDSRGLIDPTRVGIMGFSRTCWYVKYALTHSSFPFAAASVSDGIDMGYFIYAAMANRGYPDNEMDQIMGAVPSGPGLPPWMKEAPGFQVSNISSRIPVRIVASYPLDVLVEWEWFAMMKRLRKPVDMVVFLDGVHVLEKPLNRLISQGGNADWFDFWLNGREDPDPAKREQYERWRKLREATVNPATSTTSAPGPEHGGTRHASGYSSER